MNGMCRVCGCTEDHPCACGCAWLNDAKDLCTNCAEMIMMVADWALDCRQPSFALLAREAKLLYERSKAEPPAEMVIVEATEAQLRAMTRVVAGGGR